MAYPLPSKPSFAASNAGEPTGGTGTRPPYIALKKASTWALVGLGMMVNVSAGNVVEQALPVQTVVVLVGGVLVVLEGVGCVLGCVMVFVVVVPVLVVVVAV